METTTVQTIKLLIVDATGLSKDALHIHIGLFIIFFSTWIMRKPLNSPIPLVLVLLAAMMGELLDMRDDFNILGYWRWAMSIHDFINTVFWPTTLVILARTTSVLDSIFKSS